MHEVIYSDPGYVQQLSANRESGFFHISGYVIFVKNDEKTFYLACPEDNCRRKVFENDGMSE